MKFLGQVGTYIAGGASRPTKGRGAPQDNIPPFGWVGCPAGPRRDLFANKKFVKRPSGNLPPAGWAGGRLRPDQRTGGTHFSKCSPPAPLFPILFFIFFLKKSVSLWAYKPPLHTDYVEYGWAVPKWAGDSAQVQNWKCFLARAISGKKESSPIRCRLHPSIQPFFCLLPLEPRAKPAQSIE
jgi:hypothetical protein